MFSSQTILLVDDSRELLASLQLTLASVGLDVITAVNGQEALDSLEHTPVDLIIADISMPGINGYQLHQRVRANPAWVAVPFLFLTARSLDSDIRYGKELGVDDYLIKPIQPEDLLAVVAGKLLRGRQIAERLRRIADGSHYICGPLTLDEQQRRVWFRGQLVELSKREFNTLHYLAQHTTHVVSHRELVRATHDLDTTDATEASSLLRPLVRSVRRKLGCAPGEMGVIENVRGVGYRLAWAE